MTIESITDAAQLALLAACSVSLWTLRVAVAAAGRRLVAAVIAALEAVLFAVAFSAIITSLDDPLRIAGYAAGVTLGTLIGIVTDERLSTGQSLVRIVVDGDGRTEMSALRARGWPVTRTPADGVRGGVAVLTVAVDDRALSRLRTDIDGIVPAGFETIERLRAVRPTALPAGMHTTGARSRRRQSEPSLQATQRDNAAEHGTRWLPQPAAKETTRERHRDRGRTRTDRRLPLRRQRGATAVRGGPGTTRRVRPAGRPR